MAGIETGKSGQGISLEGVLSSQQQQCQSGEALAEWMSSEQVENRTSSTSPPYWESYSDDDNEANSILLITEALYSTIVVLQKNATARVSISSFVYCCLCRQHCRLSSFFNNCSTDFSSLFINSSLLYRY